MKTCTKCNQPGEFYKDPSKPDGLCTSCISCHARHAKKYYWENREKILAANQKYRQKNPLVCRKNDLKKVGLTPETYKEALEKSGGKCAICGLSKKVLVADHNHETKKFRALLCHTCNTALGKFKDSPALLRKAADYIETHP